MKTVGVAELKARLSEYLTSVKAGDEVLVTERGRVVARLSPALPLDDRDGWLVELERTGALRRPTTKLDETFWSLPRLADPEGAVLKALLAEREEGW